MSSAYDFIINIEGDTFGPNLLINPEAEGISPAVGTIAPWASGIAPLAASTCVVGGVDIYGDFVFKTPAVAFNEVDATPEADANYMYQIIASTPYTSDKLQIFGFFYCKEKLEQRASIAYMQVTVNYAEDSIRDFLYIPVNAALTDEYAGSVSGAKNFYFAIKELVLRKDVTIDYIICTVYNQDSEILYYDNLAIRQNTNTPVSRSSYTNKPMLDKYGLDTKYLEYYKNMVYNSSFELYDVDLTPTHWTGGASDANSNFSGTYSAKLEAAEPMIQSASGAIDPTWYNNAITRVSFHHRTGAVKAQVYDVTNADYFTLTAQEGTLVADASPLAGANYIDYTAHSGWEDSRESFSFDPNEFGACVSLKIKFTNIDAGVCYIDDVMLTPDFTGKWPQLYKHGPNSESAVIIDQATFTEVKVATLVQSAYDALTPDARTLYFCYAD